MGRKVRPSHMLGTCSTTEISPQPLFHFWKEDCNQRHPWTWAVNRQVIRDLACMFSFSGQIQMYARLKRRQGEVACLVFKPEKGMAPPSRGFVSTLLSCGISVYVIVLSAPDYLRCTLSMPRILCCCRSMFWYIAKTGLKLTIFLLQQVSVRDYRYKPLCQTHNSIFVLFCFTWCF